MIRPVSSLLRIARRVWTAVAGADRRDAPGPSPGVIIHDPAAGGPRDLDDPFADPKVQERVANVIAQAAGRVPPKARTSAPVQEPLRSSDG